MKQHIIIGWLLMTGAAHPQFSTKITYRDPYAGSSNISSAGFEELRGSKRDIGDLLYEVMR